MTAMPDHAPTITTLRPGILKVEAPEGSSEYLVTGGFAQINGDGLSVLAEKAIPVAEVTRSHLDDLIAEARASHVAAKAGDDQTIVDDAAKLLADMEALGNAYEPVRALACSFWKRPRLCEAVFCRDFVNAPE